MDHNGGELKAVCIDPKRLHEVWPHVSPMIKRAMDRVDFSPFDDVERDLFNEYALLWCAWDGKQILGAIVTQVSGQVCTIVALAGRDLRLWFHKLEEIENYARAEGCARMRIIGRRGWSRILKNYHQPCIVLERKL